MGDKQMNVWVQSSEREDAMSNRKLGVFVSLESSEYEELTIPEARSVATALIEAADRAEFGNVGKSA